MSKSSCGFDQNISPGAFRLPLPVAEIRRFGNGDFYPVCPRCRSTIDREYQHFCDRCGQALDWTKLNLAVVIPSP